MKHVLLLTSLFGLLGCSAEAQKKLEIEPVFVQRHQVSREIPETGGIHTYTTGREVTERLAPQIVRLDSAGGKLRFRLQGNIYSGGHNIRQVRKIRFEKGDDAGDSLILRYYVEVRKIPGKENANVAGYNYSKDISYRIPKDVKRIKVELYEERQEQGSKPRQIAEQAF